MKVLITGPQGSGKTTQAKILAQKLNLCLVSAGDLAREFAKRQEERSQQVQAELDQGRLIDDDIMFELVKNRLEKSDCEGGFVSDAYPRSESQAAFFDPDFDKVIYLDISDAEAKQRLLQRGREDDTPAAIDQRLYWYHKETEPLVEKYKTLGKLIKIDATGSVEQIAQKIDQVIQP